MFTNNLFVCSHKTSMVLGLGLDSLEGSKTLGIGLSSPPNENRKNPEFIGLRCYAWPWIEQR